MKIADENFFSWIRNSFKTSPSSHFKRFPMLMHTILVFLNNCSTNFLTILIKKSYTCQRSTIKIHTKDFWIFFICNSRTFYPEKLTGTKFDFWKKNLLPLRTIFTSPIRESLVVCLQPVKIATL